MLYVMLQTVGELVKEPRHHGDPFLLPLIMVMTQVTCVGFEYVLQQEAASTFREDKSHNILMKSLSLFFF